MSYFQFIKSNARWLAAAMLMTFSSSYGQTFFISIFAGEIQAEFNLSHTSWGAMYTLGTAVSALVMVGAGVLTDRFRARVLAPAFLIILALACVAMGTNTKVWLIPVVIFLLRFSGQGMMSHIGMVSTARWFVASRGRALSIASLGFSFGTAILPIAFVALLAVTNWRNLWFLAAGLAIMAIPAFFILLKNERTPMSHATSAESRGMGGMHWTRSMLLRHWLFWLMIPVLLGPPAWSTAMFFQQVNLAASKGWTLLEFVALFPLFTAVMIATTVAIGPVIDRFGANRVMPYYLVPFAISFLIIGKTESLAVAAVGMSIMGVGAGVGSTVVSAFWAEHCGTKYLGGVKSMAAAVMVFGSAIGPGITSYLIDRGFAFSDQMIWLTGYFIASALIATYACKRARPLLTPTS